MYCDQDVKGGRHMPNQLNTSPRKAKQKIKMGTRMSIPILLVVVFQILTFTAVLVFGGEFRYIREYAYTNLVEKTENRCNYLQNEMLDKPLLVKEYADQINGMVAGILEERDASIADLQMDKELSNEIVESTVSSIAGLLRRSRANDAYIILETGDLYEDEGGENAKLALYLRDVDLNSNLGYTDLLMEVGLTSISRAYGISRHSGWSKYFNPNPRDMENFGFYYKTMQTAQENSDLELNYLGYWSRFSRLSSAITPSMKYTMPLIADDGTVYGVLGVGMLESAVVSKIPSHDFLSETACYVLGYSTSSDNFEIMTYSGSSFDSLLGRVSSLRIAAGSEDDIYSFEGATDVDLSGSVQYIQLYTPTSPYAQERWALVSVADSASVLRPVLFLRHMLVLSALLSLVVAAIVAVPSCVGLIRPISNASKLMKAKRKYNEPIRFEPSHIYEIDEMTDAITQLQIDVQGFSSQVSKMISVADVGVGTFMYDCTDDSVFVGQSLIKVLRLHMPQDEDIVMSREEFLNSITNPEANAAIAAGMEMARSGKREDYSEVYQINRPKGGTLWMRLGYIYSPNTAIGIVQDVTEDVLEKQRIEHERDHDSLTGLLNRHAYYRHIAELFHDRDALKVTAFVMMDLDDLKFVNDTYGHDFGDDYIKMAATTLKQFQNYGGIVSRISGDEFNICLPGFSSKEEAMEIIENVHRALAQGSLLLADGTHYRIRASAGVSWYPNDADSYESLMKYADFAMYTIKHSTKGEIAEFDIEAYMQDSVLLTGMQEMNRIFDENCVRYAFQSIVSARTGEVYGYEALMRVQSDIFRSPLDLIRTAKVASRLYEIERMTWNNSLEAFRQQIDAGNITRDQHIFINTLSNACPRIVDAEPLEQKYPDLLSKIVIEILEGEDVNQEYLDLKREWVIDRWHGKLALDDFGTGYNSEYALLTIQPNIIKIDRSIINGCDSDPSRRMIIKHLVNIAKAKKILVLAEGVETEVELETVISCGVDLIQGYYIARPAFEPAPIAPEIVEKIRSAADSTDALGGGRG